MGNKVLSCDCNIIHGKSVEAARAEMLNDKHFESLARVYKTLADTTRIKILWALDKLELCVCDIAALLDMTKSAVSHQLKYLADANLILPRRDGKNVYYRLRDGHVKQMIEIAMEHIDCREAEYVR